MTDSARWVRWQWAYSGYGETAPQALALPTVANVAYNLRYPGQVDDGNGLFYNWHRFYHPASGRYVSADPIGLDGGWNRFGYVGGNALSGVDPEGLHPRSSPPRVSYSQALLNLQANNLSTQIRQIVPNYSYTYASTPGQGFTAANVTQLQGTLQRMQSLPVCPVNSVIAETLAARGNVTSQNTLTTDQLLRAGETFLGPGYREIGRPGSGVFRSSDGARQFRIDNNSIRGNHAPGVPHGHLETYAPGANMPTANNHIPFK